jgi:hypothetical protein
MEVSTFVIGPETPSGAAWGSSIWIDTVHRQIKEYKGGAWVVLVDFANYFKPEGYTGEIKHGNNLMVFENGLLVKYK